MYHLSVESILDLLLVHLWGTEWRTERCVGQVVPGNEQATWVWVAFGFQLVALELVDLLDTEESVEVKHVNVPKTARDGCDVVCTSRHVFWDDLVDGKVGGDQDRRLGELRRLVLLVDSEACFITQCLDKVDRESLDGLVVQIFEHNVRMHFGIIQVKKLVVQVLLVVVWVHVRQNRRLPRSWVAPQPDVWISVGLEEVSLLDDHRLDLLAILQVGPWELGERFVTLVGLNESLHLDQDFIDLAFLLLFAGFDNGLVGVFG